MGALGASFVMMAVLNTGYDDPNPKPPAIYCDGLASSPLVAKTMAVVPTAAAAMRVMTRALLAPPTSSVEAAVTINDAALPSTTLPIALVPTILPAVLTISIT